MKNTTTKMAIVLSRIKMIGFEYLSKNLKMKIRKMKISLGY